MIDPNGLNEPNPFDDLVRATMEMMVVTHSTWTEPSMQQVRFEVEGSGAFPIGHFGEQSARDIIAEALFRKLSLESK